MVDLPENQQLRHSTHKNARIASAASIVSIENITQKIDDFPMKSSNERGFSVATFA